MIGGCNYGNKAYKCFKGYKEGKGYSAKAEQKEIGEKLQWLREFISLSDDIKDGDAKEYYDSICGLISATEGTVEIDGKILRKDMTFPDSVGVLIENPAFIGNYTGFKNLKVLASIQNRVDDEHIREVIHQVGLDPDDKRTYRKYSLGMKQKLGIAAAYMENPDLIILDEPINALDEAGAKQVHEILEEQKKRGALIIIACHDKEELEMLSDEIIEISEGRIIEK